MKIYTRTGDTGKTSLVGGTRVDKFSPRLEAYGTVDELNSFNDLLPPLTSFILPGGCTAACYAHLCRTVCRRAERRVLALEPEITVAQIVVKFINRLSDYFFTLSRYVNLLTSNSETPWIPG